MITLIMLVITWIVQIFTGLIFLIKKFIINSVKYFGEYDPYLKVRREIPNSVRKEFNIKIKNLRMLIDNDENNEACELIDEMKIYFDEYNIPVKLDNINLLLSMLNVRLLWTVHLFIMMFFVINGFVLELVVYNFALFMYAYIKFKVLYRSRLIKDGVFNNLSNELYDAFIHFSNSVKSCNPVLNEVVIPKPEINKDVKIDLGTVNEQELKDIVQSVGKSTISIKDDVVGFINSKLDGFNNRDVILKKEIILELITESVIVNDYILKFSITHNNKVTTSTILEYREMMEGIIGYYILESHKDSGVVGKINYTFQLKQLPEKLNFNGEKLLSKFKDDGYQFYVGETFDGSVYINMKNRPHILNGGGSGSGKGNILTLLAMQFSRVHEVVFIDVIKHCVDLKSFSDKGYPMITDIETAKSVMTHLVDKIQIERLNLFKRIGVSSIDAYNSCVVNEGGEPLRYIQVFIDEFNGMVEMANSKEGMSDLITLVERMGRETRAVGINLIYSGQSAKANEIDTSLRGQFSHIIVGKCKDKHVSNVFLGNDLASTNRVPKLITCEGRHIIQMPSSEKGRMTLEGDHFVVQAPFVKLGENEFNKNEFEPLIKECSNEVLSKSVINELSGVIDVSVKDDIVKDDVIKDDLDKFGF